MSTREILTEEIKKAPEAILNELYDFLMFLKQKDGKFNEKALTTLHPKKYYPAIGIHQKMMKHGRVCER